MKYHSGEYGSRHRQDVLLAVQVLAVDLSELGRPVSFEAEAQTQLIVEPECYDLEKMLGKMMLKEAYLADIGHILGTEIKEEEEEEQGEPRHQARPCLSIESLWYKRTGLKAVRDEHSADVAWALDFGIEGSRIVARCHKARPLGQEEASVHVRCSHMEEPRNRDHLESLTLIKTRKGSSDHIKKRKVLKILYMSAVQSPHSGLCIDSCVAAGAKANGHKAVLCCAPRRPRVRYRGYQYGDKGGTTDPRLSGPFQGSRHARGRWLKVWGRCL